MSTTLDELTDLVFLESGEFIIGDLDALNLDREKFWLLSKRVLGVYNKYRAYTVNHNITVSAGLYVYTTSSTYGIPSWISAVVPVQVTNVIDIYRYHQKAVSEKIDEYTLLEIPRGFEWRYEDPKLYVTEDGIMDVTEHHNHDYTETTTDGGVLTGVAFSTLDITEDRFFIDLLVARFMIAVGRSRRAFTLNDLPITMDASELVTEGNELWDRTIEKLEETGRWWDAIGNL